MRNLHDNPPVRYPNKAIAEAENPWVIAHVYSRQEKAFAEELVFGQIEYYLPMYTKVTRRIDNNKLRKSILPLFPGYVCVACNKQAYKDLYATGRIAEIIEIKNQSRFIKEISSIYSAFESGTAIEPFTEKKIYCEGEFAIIHAGPFRGLTGKIVRCNNEISLKLMVEGLGMALLSINVADVRPINESGTLNN